MEIKKTITAGLIGLLSLSTLLIFLDYNGSSLNADLLSLTTNKKIIKYSVNQLWKIRSEVNKDPRLKTLHPDTINIIRKYRIHRKRRRGRRGGKCVTKQNSVHDNQSIRQNRIYHGERLIEIRPGKPIIKFLMLNAHSIKNKDEELSQYMQENEVDFTLLTETWLQKNNEIDLDWIQATPLNTDGYCFINGFSRQDRKGGGIAISFKATSLSAKLLELDLPNYQSFESALWKINNKYDEFILVGIYHPPTSTTNPSNNMFLDEFSEFIGQIRIKFKKFLFLGDFNIHINKHDDIDSEQFSQILEVHGLYQLIDFTTHVHGNILDLIIVNESMLNLIGNVTPGPFFSDHCCVLGNVDLVKPKTPLKTISYRNFNEANREKFFLDIDLERNPGTDLHSYLSYYEESIKNSLDTNAPIKKKKISELQSKPWYTKSLNTYRKLVRNLEHKFRKYRLSHQLIAFKTERKKYRSAVYMSKKSYISTTIMKNKGNSKTLYELTNQLTGRKKTNTNLPKHNTDISLANDFSEFFLNKIQTIRDNLSQYPKYEPPTREIEVLDRLSVFREVSSAEVKRKILSMKTKSCELDILKTSFLKEYLHVFLHSIKEIINKSLLEGHFHDSWKTAIIRPLIKNPKKDAELSNFRPVSNLSFLSKVVEGIAIDQLQEHVKLHDFYPEHQSAYRESHSCETALIKLCNDILWAMENKMIFLLIGTDLSAAFDTIDHDIISKLLENFYGVSGTVRTWFESYLNNRNFKVTINGKFSDAKYLSFSIPQGSRGGPDLFNLSCATLSTILPPDLNIYAYADDHNFSDCYYPDKEGKNELECVTKMQNFLGEVGDWMNKNRLKMNPDKTEFITFGSHQLQQRNCISNINVLGTSVLKALFVRFLGVWLDQFMKFNIHINKKCAVARANLIKIARIRKFLDQKSCEVLVLSLVMSHLDYCNAILYGVNDTLLKKFQVIQNSAAKLTLQWKRQDSSTEALKKLHWLPIKARIEFKILLIVYKFFNGKTPVYINNLLEVCKTNGYSLRNKDWTTLKVPYVSKESHASRSFSVCAPKLWNKLPQHIRIALDLETFKRKLKTHLFKQYFENNDIFVYY